MAKKKQETVEETAPVQDPTEEAPVAVAEAKASPRAWARSDGRVLPGHSDRSKRQLAGHEEGLLQETRRDPEVEMNVEQFLTMAIMELCAGDTTTTKVNDELQLLFPESMNGRQQDQLLGRIKAYLTRMSKSASDLAKAVRIK